MTADESRRRISSTVTESNDGEVAEMAPSDSSLGASEVVYTFGFLQAVDESSNPLPVLSADSQRIALGEATWCNTFWLPTQQRKHPNYELSITNTDASADYSDQSRASPKFVVTTTEEAINKDAGGKVVDWNKLLQTSLKKICVEDLGDLAASELLATIPEEDSEGRGLKDLAALEKQLSVRVVWSIRDNHILLVGNKNKLEKKCLVLRNILSHYYWRLKGKQINL